MVITRKDIEYMREDLCMNISVEKEEEILLKLGSEPDDYSYSEQDIHDATSNN